MRVISGSSNPQLANAIATQLGTPLVECELTSFKNGEKRVFIKENVRGENIALVQSFNQPVDTNIVEFLLLADALERAGARHVNAIIPWMGYSLQDKVFRAGEPIAAKVIANLVSHAYIKRAFLLELHNSSTPGFFNIPTVHLSTLKIFTQYARENWDVSQVIVASPDFGGIKRSRIFANELQVNLVNIDKHRHLDSGEITAHDVHGDVENKIVLLYEDCVQSGSTALEAASLLKKRGAKEVHFFAAHGPLVTDAYSKLDDPAIDSLVTTNSIHHAQLHPKMTVVDISSLVAQALATWA